jgi:hypothetical protein
MCNWRRSTLLGLLPIACMADTTSNTFDTRDSSGVVIVENRRTVWQEGPAWVLEPTPSVDIGAMSGSPEYELFQANSAVRLANGQIVVANSGSAELRFYDRAGKHIRSVGGRGSGPGEFENLLWVRKCKGDSLLVWDLRLRRGSVFDTTGEYQRSFTLPAEASYIPFISFKNGTLLAQQASQWMDQEWSDGVQRPAISVLRFSPDGEQLADIGAFPADEYWGSNDGEHPHRWRRAFGRRMAVAVSDSLIWIGTADDFSIDAYDLDGTLVRRVRVPMYETRAVREDHLAVWVQDAMATLEASMAEHMRPFFEGVRPPDRLPPYERILVDSEGYLWTEHYVLPGDERRTLSVFREDGSMLGDVSVPASFRVLEIGRDYMLGRMLDELEVEHVQLYRLARGQVI